MKHSSDLACRPRLSVVILNWNAYDDTIRCVREVLLWQRVEPRIWVVDNASDGSDADAIAAACPEVELIRSQHNLGFSGGTNLGLRAAMASSPAPLLLLNNDASLPESSALSLLETLQSDPRCAVVGPVITSASDPGAVVSAGSRSPVLNRNHAITRPPSGSEVYPVHFVSGAAALIRSEVLEQIGLLDERYFFGLELADLCRRAREHGQLCLVDARARVEHAIERSSDLRETLYVYYVVRNRFLYARRFHRACWPLLHGLWAAYGLQQALRLRRKGRRGTATAILLGVRDGLVRRYGDRNRAVLAACSAAPNQEEGRL